eukprot:Rhum_TRINITY_DN14494_c8_g3::Rhum_TRINITY_DN14494_c8_g3_i1::g.92935::m.92935
MDQPMTQQCIKKTPPPPPSSTTTTTTTSHFAPQHRHRLQKGPPRHHRTLLQRHAGHDAASADAAARRQPRELHNRRPLDLRAGRHQRLDHARRRQRRLLRQTRQEALVDAEVVQGLLHRAHVVEPRAGQTQAVQGHALQRIVERLARRRQPRRLSGVVPLRRVAEVGEVRARAPGADRLHEVAVRVHLRLHRALHRAPKDRQQLLRDGAGEEVRRVREDLVEACPRLAHDRALRTLRLHAVLVDELAARRGARGGGGGAVGGVQDEDTVVLADGDGGRVPEGREAVVREVADGVVVEDEVVRAGHKDAAAALRHLCGHVREREQL